jgi:hypothetical protein
MNDEILGGLKSALERGESLKRAMLTFFNAGYKREEIEEAARNLNAQDVQPTVIPVKTTPLTSAQSIISKTIKQVSTVQSLEPPLPPVQPQESISSQQQPQVVKQKVSNYGEEKKSRTLIHILIGVLIFLFCVIASIFVFKDELINFFSSFFT